MSHTSVASHQVLFSRCWPRHAVLNQTAAIILVQETFCKETRSGRWKPPFTAWHSPSLAAGWPWQKRQGVDEGTGAREPAPALHCGLSDRYQCCWATFVGSTGWAAAKGRDRITAEKKRKTERKGKTRGGVRIDGGRTGGSWRWRPRRVEECSSSPPRRLGCQLRGNEVKWGQRLGTERFWNRAITGGHEKREQLRKESVGDWQSAGDAALAQSINNSSPPGSKPPSPASSAAPPSLTWQGPRSLHVSSQWKEKSPSSVV